MKTFSVILLLLLAGCAYNEGCPTGYYKNYSDALLEGKKNAPQYECRRCQYPDCPRETIVNGPDRLPFP